MPTSTEAVLQPSHLHLLVVEDDAGDALLVQELLASSPPDDGNITAAWARSISEAHERCAAQQVDCVLVDLGLPDATGLGALAAMVEACPEAAVVVLTGQRDRGLALAAVSAGAQDYLIKGDVNPALLDRTIRLAVQRRLIERANVALVESSVRERHNRQVVRGLLPHLRVRDRRLRMVTRYRPGNSGEVLGGDFLDAVELDDGTVRAVIGDVAGHGPEEAAVGVNLRIAWRALTVSANPPETVFRVLNDQVAHDTDLDEVFATVAAVSINPARDSLSVRVAGHPSPILWSGSEVSELVVPRAPVVGFALEETPPEAVLGLPSKWRLLLYTDGLVEGRDGGGAKRWGATGLLSFLEAHADSDPEELADLAIAEATRRHGGPLPDDVAILLICHDA